MQQWKAQSIHQGMKLIKANGSSRGEDDRNSLVKGTQAAVSVAAGQLDPIHEDRGTSMECNPEAVVAGAKQRADKWQTPVSRIQHWRLDKTS